MDKKGKGKVKEKAQGSANVLDITDLPELSTNPSIFPATRQVKKLNGSWIVGAQITSHQEKMVLSNTGNLDKHTMW